MRDAQNLLISKDRAVAVAAAAAGLKGSAVSGLGDAAAMVAAQRKTAELQRELCRCGPQMLSIVDNYGVHMCFPRHVVMLCNVLCYAMLCCYDVHVALCCVMICLAMLWCAMLCCVVLCYVMPECYAMLCYATLCMACYATMLCHAMM